MTQEKEGKRRKVGGGGRQLGRGKAMIFLVPGTLNLRYEHWVDNSVCFHIYKIVET